MNTASQDLSKHLGILHDRLTHPTDYEKALTYFLEEFAGDFGFIQQSLEEEAPHLRVVARLIAAQATGQAANLEQFGARYLPGHGFFHGRAIAAGQVLLFLYFEKTNVGLMALMLGVNRQNQVARFSLPPNAAPNPKHN
jgi:hypothetical protein